MHYLLNDASDRAGSSFIHIHSLLEAAMIFLASVIYKRWHTWIGRRTSGDKMIAGTRAGWEEEKDNADGAGDVEAE